MDFNSQVRVSITEMIFKFILDDSMANYLNELHLFNQKELTLLSHIKEGNYKSIEVTFKAKNKDSLTLKKGKHAQHKVLNFIRYEEYEELKVLDLKECLYKVSNVENLKIV